MQDPTKHSTQAPLVDAPQSQFAKLWRRAYLTYRYHGPWSVMLRVVSFPLRFTPLKRFVRFGPGQGFDRTRATRWYRTSGRHVTVVIPSYRDADQVAALVKSIRKTTKSDRIRIVVSDDASGPEHLEQLRSIQGIEIIESERNAGFAANANRGINAASKEDDVVILNSDTVARRGWLESLQYATTRGSNVGIVGAKLLYPDDRIQFAGTIRNPQAPEWFDHRYRFKPMNWGPANIPEPVLAVTGACMYVKREVIDEIGLLDESYQMAYEDVDYCLRAWRSGYEVLYWPGPELYHLESVTRGTEVNERERSSQRAFWTRWGDGFDAREVRNRDGLLRVIYVTEDTGVGGGHRDIFEHLNGLQDRGHAAELWTLGQPPDWFSLRAPIRSFEDYDDLVRALEPVEAIKVATWWTTAAPVWRASVVHGIPVYFVQDIETSYYPDDDRKRYAVLASYQHEFHYMTISSWNRDRLNELGLSATLVPPGIDLENFRPLPTAKRRDDMIVALGRSNPLKNLPLTVAAWRALPDPRPELVLFGIEPGLAAEPGIRYVVSPSDDEVNHLFNEAAAFVQTSSHEGFCLPALEAMAAGSPVVCTDAHGNRDFCIDEVNCLMPDHDSQSVSNALERLRSEPLLGERLGRAGIETAAAYAWPNRIDALERFFIEIATPRRIEPSTDTVPELRRAPAG